MRRLALGAAIALLASPGAARAQGPSLTAALLGGVARPDAALADYQWDTRPKFTAGAEAIATLGPWGAGLRYTRSSTTQELGSASSTPTARVATRAYELVARRRVAAFGGQSLFADAAIGRTRLSYAPDHVQIDAGGTPVDVALDPVAAWSWGGGIGAQRALGRAMVLGLEVGYRSFAMDAAHTSGGAVVIERRTFAEWSTRFTLGWRIHS